MEENIKHKMDSKERISKAYHRLILQSGEVIPMAIVHFGKDGSVLSWERFTEELPSTIWVGGDFDMRLV